MNKNIRLTALVIILLVSFSQTSIADDFVATKSAVIHEQDNSTSKEIGRLSQGDRVPILERNGSGTYFKVKTDVGMVGWVSKTRGKIIYTQAETSETGTTSVPTGPKTYNFYFGNLHSHVSELSTEPNVADSTFEDAFEYAMTEGGLDFLAITIHSHLSEPGAYSKLLSIAKDPRFDKPGKFAPIAGQEFNSISKGNHINVFEVDELIKPEDVPNGEFKKLYEDWYPKHKASYSSIQFNHPYSATFTSHNGQEYGRDDYDGDLQSLLQATDQLVSTIEIIKTDSHDDATDKPHMDEDTKRLSAWLFALNEGWHLAPTANQDNHRRNWGTATESRTVCIAPELTKKAILEAIKNRRCYATEDENMKVTFKAGNAWMGSVVDINEISGLSIKVEDNGEPKATYTVNLYKGSIGGKKLTINSAPVKTLTLKNKEEVNYPIDNPELDSYYFLRVTQSNNSGDPNQTADDAWTAPIWVGESH